MIVMRVTKINDHDVQIFRRMSYRSSRKKYYFPISAVTYTLQTAILSMNRVNDRKWD